MDAMPDEMQAMRDELQAIMRKLGLEWAFTSIAGGHLTDAYYAQAGRVKDDEMRRLLLLVPLAPIEIAPIEDSEKAKAAAEYIRERLKGEGWNVEG